MGPQPAAPLRFLPGGAIRLDPAIPLSVGPDPLGPAHREIAAALRARRQVPDTFRRAVAPQSAAQLIETAFKNIIAETLAPIDAATMELGVAIRLREGHPGIGALIITNERCIITPSWFDDPKVADGVKSAVWATLTTHLPKLLPVGTTHDLLENLSAYYWDGETDDEAVKAALVEYHGMDPDEATPLPSDFVKATPEWISAPATETPAHVAEAIRAVEDAAARYEKISRRRRETFAWNIDFQMAADIEPHYEDSVAVQPIWLMPLNETFNNALDMITEVAMQTTFFDVCGVAELTTAKHISKWLDDLAVGVDYIAALVRLLQLDPTKPTP